MHHNFGMAPLPENMLGVQFIERSKSQCYWPVYNNEAEQCGLLDFNVFTEISVCHRTPSPGVLSHGFLRHRAMNSLPLLPWWLCSAGTACR